MSSDFYCHCCACFQMMQVSQVLSSNRGSSDTNRDCAAKHKMKAIDSHVAFAGYLIAFLTIFLVAASPRSMPQISDSLIRYNNTSDSSSPRCSFSDSSQFGRLFATSPLHIKISASSPTSPTCSRERERERWVQSLHSDYVQVSDAYDIKRMQKSILNVCKMSCSTFGFCESDSG